VGNRRAEDGHHGVADELLNRAGMPLELVADASVVRGEQLANVLGVEPLGLGGEANEVDEDNGDVLSLLGERRSTSCSGAAQALQKRAPSGLSWPQAGHAGMDEGYSAFT
jgi:hypothetical protein